MKRQEEVRIPFHWQRSWVFVLHSDGLQKDEFADKPNDFAFKYSLSELQ